MTAWFISTAFVMWGMIGLFGFVYWNFLCERVIPFWNMVISFFVSIILGPIGWIIASFTGVNRKGYDKD